VSTTNQQSHHFRTAIPIFPSSASTFSPLKDVFLCNVMKLQKQERKKNPKIKSDILRVFFYETKNNKKLFAKKIN
jgi:hypothetical protein